MRYAGWAVAVLIAGSSIAYSQDVPNNPPQDNTQSGNTKTPVINKRQRRQQRRIAQGEKSGQLTAGEAARLEKREAKIERDKQAARSDGRVTPAERRKLRREENRTSRKIHRLKHNDKTQ